jgi:S-formylglutathione hydrolase FrmB
MYHALKYPDVWSAAGVHSADMGFEWVFLPDMPKALRALASHDMSFETFLKAFDKGPHYKGDDIHALMLLAMGASYAPDPEAYCGVSLPVDLHTCELDEAQWNAWKAYDPIVMLDEFGENLKKLKGLWIDCGDKDQFNMVYPARQMHNHLEKRGVQHVYEEFPDNHFSLDYRFDRSLPFLVNALNS